MHAAHAILEQCAQCASSDNCLKVGLRIYMYHVLPNFYTIYLCQCFIIFCDYLSFFRRLKSIKLRMKQIIFNTKFWITAKEECKKVSLAAVFDEALYG